MRVLVRCVRTWMGSAYRRDARSKMERGITELGRLDHGVAQERRDAWARSIKRDAWTQLIKQDAICGLLTGCTCVRQLGCKCVSKPRRRRSL